MSGLRECPFCGSHAITDHDDAIGNFCRCSDTDCIMGTPDDWYSISAWNRRADDRYTITPKGLAMLGEDAE